MATPNYDDILHWKYSTSSSSTADNPYRNFSDYVSTVLETTIPAYQSEFVKEYLCNFPMEKEYQKAAKIFGDRLAKQIDEDIINQIQNASSVGVENFKKEYMFDPNNIWSEPACLRPSIAPNVVLK